jgi:hypothetical protein
LAGGLETLVTSDYDYAKYLKDIVLEPMNGGDKGERAYRYYMYDLSCGKFMNTLFLLALRKAKVLETFKLVVFLEERSYVLTISADGISAWNSAGQSSKRYIKFQPSNISISECKPAILYTQYRQHRASFITLKRPLLL